jgi:superfamily II DNA/RNA helicase
LAPLLDQLRRCVRRANDYQKTGQEGRAQSAYLDLHDCLEVLSERTPEVDPSAAHYYLLQDRHLRDVVQSIELAPLHPKMQMLLSHIEIHGRDSGNGIFIRIAETTDLYDYVSVLRSRGFHVAFVIGGENASNDIELNNRLACQGFAAGRHNIILTTDVCNNGIELPAANMLFLKDVPGNAGDVIQWFGRVGREAGMRTDVFPMFLDVPGSHDQRRKHLSWVQRDREQASTERSASTHTSEESAVYLSVGPLFDTRSASE